jgi:hypothetical protein
MALNTNQTTDTITPSTGGLTVAGNIVPVDGSAGGNIYIKNGNESPVAVTGCVSIWFNAPDLYVKTSTGALYKVTMTLEV